MKQKRIEKQNKDRVEEAKKIQKQERLNSQAKQEVAKRGLLLERDSMLRQQKLKALFGGADQGSMERLPEPTSILAQQATPEKAPISQALAIPGTVGGG